MWTFRGILAYGSRAKSDWVAACCRLMLHVLLKACSGLRAWGARCRAEDAPLHLAAMAVSLRRDGKGGDERRWSLASFAVSGGRLARAGRRGLAERTVDAYGSVHVLLRFPNYSRMFCHSERKMCEAI